MNDLGLAIKLVSRNFFDRDAVKTAADKATNFNLPKFGAFVRQRAKTSIRPRKGTSAPGAPPHSHTGLLRNNIFFTYDGTKKSVVIGPIFIERKNSMGGARVLEEGGTVQRRGKTLTYSPRPYMLPAFNEERADLARFWKNSVTK